MKSTDAQIVILHSQQVLQEWWKGCDTPCSDEQRGLGACACHNIYHEKMNDRQNIDIYCTVKRKK